MSVQIALYARLYVHLIYTCILNNGLFLFCQIFQDMIANIIFIFSKIVLVAVQDDAKNKMRGAAYKALRRIGARSPFNADFRGSFAMIGYTGPGRPPFVKQVK